MESSDWTEDMYRICTRCKVKYPKTLEYFNNKRNTVGNLFLDTRCKTCHSALRVETKQIQAGIELLPEHIKKAYTKSCWCCGAEDKTLQIDHDHKTGNFRGMICKSCNITLGRHYKDSYKGAKDADAPDMYLTYLKGSLWRSGKGLK